MKRLRNQGIKGNANASGPPLSPLPADERIRSGWHRLLLVGVFAVYLWTASSHALTVPTGSTGYQDAPDEEAHVTYMRVIAQGRLPSRKAPGPAGDARPSYEWHQPPLYYALGACVLPFGEKSVRFYSILLGTACILTVYRAARMLLPMDRGTAVLAAGIAALIPGHCAITSVVNNDVLLELGFSATLLLLIHAGTYGFTVRHALAIGSVIGAALLTKVTAVLLIPVTLVALVLFWRSGERRITVVSGAVVIAMAAALVSGWWFARNIVLYHELIPFSAFRQSFEGTAKASDVVGGRLGIHVDGWMGYVMLVSQWTFQSFFAVYSTQLGSRNGAPAFLAPQLYRLAALVTLTSVVGVAALPRAEGLTLGRAQKYSAIVLALTLALISASFAMFAARYFQAQGRYFYPAMLPIAVLGALGWQAVFPQRYRSVASAMLLTFLFAFDLAFLRATT